MSNERSLSNSTLLVTGGCGSFGQMVLKHYLTTDIKEIRIYSRDEMKHDNLRHELQRLYPKYAHKVKFIIGDVRDLETVRKAMHGVDYVFSAAATKIVPSCDFYPLEAVKTNIIGTDNVITAAIENKVKCVVCLSTDKAAYPVNCMGGTKFISECVARARSYESKDTVICCTRYGNVLCSHGSVVPLWIDQIEKGQALTITNPDMTRFLMTLDEAVDLVEFAFTNAKPGDLFVQKANASTIKDLALATQKLFGDTGLKIIGTRSGEKVAETLVTEEEMFRAEDMGNYYRIPAVSNSLNYDIDTNVIVENRPALTSHNATRLDVDQTAAKLLTTDYVKEKLNESISDRK